MGSQQQLCLRWNNHQSNILNVFEELLEQESLVDVTLACDARFLKAHKVVLSACSPYFQALFNSNPCKHPIVILKDVKYEELQCIVNFMYKGEVSIEQQQLEELLKVAGMLQIRGLTEVKEKVLASSKVTKKVQVSGEKCQSAPSSPASKRKKRAKDHQTANDSCLQNVKANAAQDSNEMQETCSKDMDILQTQLTIGEKLEMDGENLSFGGEPAAVECGGESSSASEPHLAPHLMAEEKSMSVQNTDASSTAAMGSKLDVVNIRSVSSHEENKSQIDILPKIFNMQFPVAIQLGFAPNSLKRKRGRPRKPCVEKPPKKFYFHMQADIYLLNAVLQLNPYKYAEQWNVIQKIMEEDGYSCNIRQCKDRINFLINSFTQANMENLSKTGSEEQFNERTRLVNDVIQAKIAANST